MFLKSQRFYDAIYAWKDYAAESQRPHALILRYKRSDGNALLDVACGTGGHITHLRERYGVEGLDLDPEMLAIARRKHPDIPFHHGDMVDVSLGRRFDVVVCLFSAIGEVKTPDRLRQAARAMARHLRPGGLLIIEPWLTPETFRAGHLGARFVDQPDLKIARLNLTAVQGRVSHPRLPLRRGHFVRDRVLHRAPRTRAVHAGRIRGSDDGGWPRSLLRSGGTDGARPVHRPAASFLVRRTGAIIHCGFRPRLHGAIDLSEEIPWNG